MNVLKYSLGVVAICMLASCVKQEDSPGYEWTPDMYRSPSVEAYTDYGYIKDRYNDSIKNQFGLRTSARKPVGGTIPFTQDADLAKVNMPYRFAETNEGYEAAGRELSVPSHLFKDVDQNLAKGSELYVTFCIHCHGESGKGDGNVVTVGGHSRPGAYDGALKYLPVGKMFHTLTYGKGMMGSHASQLSKLERWQVIMHVQTLQNGGEFPMDRLKDSSRDASGEGVATELIGHSIIGKI